jgi:hypothetical protein
MMTVFVMPRMNRQTAHLPSPLRGEALRGPTLPTGAES